MKGNQYWMSMIENLPEQEEKETHTLPIKQIIRGKTKGGHQEIRFQTNREICMGDKWFQAETVMTSNQDTPLREITLENIGRLSLM